ncbi:hypothetical protein HAL07_00900 [Helicobacter ailurogastricus]|uniref:Uncharacterized protein n=1 Tax=Helicobacter ailurogastricus TaxID=1578720 RepID=A0A0K2X504_9HELI|nr:hypothetical protein HAL011_08370 [Helicobacter ailurogastricus]CRF42349.1 hypothetical protein HAL013_05180 [Helicobacter ailurogastricus]CRF44753.1 hypothetical protein HAL09_13650 [Helicobacter ailurogastricus]CRF51964.1 hypothetical protein HAL07_00900 [Helicobacter ailurogastricus]
MSRCAKKTLVPIKALNGCFSHILPRLWYIIPPQKCIYGI